MVEGGRGELSLHLILHLLVPAAVAGIFFRQNMKPAYLAMIATMLVDTDHLMANPVYDPGRCSIGFHPLHGYIPTLLYASLCFVPRMRYLRYVSIGLVIHMALDSLDCQMTNGVWFV